MYVILVTIGRSELIVPISGHIMGRLNDIQTAQSPLHFFLIEIYLYTILGLAESIQTINQSDVTRPDRNAI